MSNLNSINVIVWGYKEEQARNVLSQLCCNCEANANFCNFKYNDYTINIFIRYHGMQNKESPKELTDILILAADDDSIGLAKEYLDKRRGIPFRFVVGGKFSDDDAQYIENFKESKDFILQTAVNHDIALKDVFNKIDTNKNGYLDRDEIIRAAKELNHSLLEGDANEIIAVMGEDSKISFDSFRHWWHLGRLDFSSFRSIVSLKLKLSSFVNSNVTQFVNYLESINTINENSDCKNRVISKISILPTDEKYRENHQTSINLHCSLGDEYDVMKKNFPLYYNEAATFGVEIPLKSKCEEENLETMKNLDKIFKAFFLNDSPLSNLHDKGFQFNSRLQGEIAIYEFCFGGMIGDLLCHTIKTLKLDKVNYSLHCDSHISTSLSFLKMLENNKMKVNEFIKDLIKFIIEFKIDSNNLKQIIELVENTLKSYYPQFYSKYLQSLFTTIQGLLIVKNCNISLDYEAEQLYDHIVKLDISYFDAALSEVFPKLYDIYASIGPGTIIEELFALLRKCDLDKISVFFSTPLIRAFIKMTFIIQGLDVLLDKPFK